VLQTAKSAGWSGGQYSVARAVLGSCLIGLFLDALARADPMHDGRIPYFPDLLAVSGAPSILLSGAWVVVCGLLVVFGWRDRVGAGGLAYLWLCLLNRQALPAGASSLLIGAPILAHLFVPRAPYGSWVARSRPDPGAGWRMPGWIHQGLWICLALGYAYDGASKWRSSAIPFEFLAVPLALWPRARPWLWLGLVVVGLGAAPFAASFGAALAPLVILVYTFAPGWVPPVRCAGRDTLFYDGHCGLCHGWVRFVLAEDEKNDIFRFAPLESDAFERRVPEEQRADLPDSLVLCRVDGTLLVRSAAIRHILGRLGGIWRVAGVASGIVPAPIRDRAYAAVAAVRHRLFRRPATSCPVIPPHLRTRFE